MVVQTTLLSILFHLVGGDAASVVHQWFSQRCGWSHDLPMDLQHTDPMAGNRGIGHGYA